LAPPETLASPPLELDVLPASLPEHEVAPQRPMAASPTAAQVVQVIREVLHSEFIMPAIGVESFQPERKPTHSERLMSVSPAKPVKLALNWLGSML